MVDLQAFKIEPAAQWSVQWYRLTHSHSVLQNFVPAHVVVEPLKGVEEQTFWPHEKYYHWLHSRVGKRDYGGPRDAPGEVDDAGDAAPDGAADAPLEELMSDADEELMAEEVRGLIRALTSQAITNSDSTVITYVHAANDTRSR